MMAATKGKYFTKKVLLTYKRLDFAVNCVFIDFTEKVNVRELRHAWPRLPGSAPEGLGTYRCKGRNGPFHEQVYLHANLVRTR